MRAVAERPKEACRPYSPPLYVKAPAARKRVASSAVRQQVRLRATRFSSCFCLGGE